MKKIVHMTSVHAPNDDRIVLKECVSLLNAGYDVALVYLGECSEIVDNRLHYVCAGEKSFGRFARMMGGVWSVFWTALRLRADLYHFHDPELISAGIVLKLLGKKVIYDAHEDLPKQIMDKEWLPAYLRGGISYLFEKVERLGAACFDGVVTVAEEIQARFNSNKCICVFNYSWRNELDTTDVAWNSREDAFVYVGSLSASRNIEGMLEAAEKAQKKLYLAGRFDLQSYETKVKNQYPATELREYAGFLGRQDVHRLLEKSCCGLCLLQPTKQYVAYYRAVKLFEYMTAGIPVIASDFPAMKNFVENHRIGICVDPLDTNAIAEAMQWIASHPEEAAEMGKRGRALVEQEYNWEHEGNKLCTFYKQILN